MGPGCAEPCRACFDSICVVFTRLSHPVVLALATLLLAGVLAVVIVTVVRSGDGAPAQAKPVDATAFRPDKTKLTDCNNHEPKCMEQAFANIAYHQGPKPALKLLDSKMASDPVINAGCHRIAHGLGAGALLHNKGDIGITFAQGSSTCWSGYYHGILERAYTGVPNSRLGATSAKLCISDQVRTTQFLHYQCVHGLGHGLMIHTSYDMPAALKVCESLTDPWESVSCDGGVFMENVAASRDIKSKWLHDDDGVYPCQTVAERHKYYCYLMVTSRVNELNGFNWKDTAKTCATKAEKGWRGTCFESYGRDVSGQNRTDLRKIVRLCVAAGPYQASCVWGVARDMVSQDDDAHRAARFCMMLATGQQNRCFQAVGTIVSNQKATQPERDAACRDLGKKYANACISGTLHAPEGILDPIKLATDSEAKA